MFEALRYYWITTRGYRFNPWNSPYIRWRFETFLGAEATAMDAGKFLRLCWKYRDRMESFIKWAGQRRREQRTHNE